MPGRNRPRGHCADEFSADSIELNPTVKMPYNLKRFAYRLARQDKSIELVAMNSDKLEGLLREHKEEYLIPLKEHAAYESMIDAGDGELYPVLTPGQTFVTYAEFYFFPIFCVVYLEIFTYSFKFILFLLHYVQLLNF